MRLWSVLVGAWLITAAACTPRQNADPACTAQFDALAAISDYSSSEVGAVMVDGGTYFRAGIDLGQDPALAVSRGRAFFIDRITFGNIFELSPACGNPIAEFSGNVPSQSGVSNAQDLAVDPSGQLWIAEFDVPDLLILAPNGTPARTIDLSRFDADGNPNMSSVQILDGIGAEPAPKAFVALERLNDLDMLLSQQPSMMIRIDVTSGDVDEQIELPGRNPFGLIVEEGGLLWMAAPGNFSSINEPDAGIESLDPQTFTARLVVPETSLGGSVTEVAISGSCGIAIVAGDTPNVNPTSLVSFNADTGEVTADASNPILSTPSGFFLQALAWVGTNTLLVGEGAPAPSPSPPPVVHVLSRSSPDSSTDCTLTETRRIPVPLKPIALHATPLGGS